MANSDIQAIEKQIFELNMKLVELRKQNTEVEQIKNYQFDTLNGKKDLLDLFANKDRLLVIHNMGQGCRYCTLWADGLNGFLPHLEATMAVVLVSKDSPELQRTFANSRGWHFNLASHGGGDYIKEQNVMPDENNAPGVVLYERKGDHISRKNSAAFGPGDLYCSMWSLLGLAGLGVSDWTPQYKYWQQPQQLDDGGENVL